MWQLITDATVWNTLLCQLPSPHVLQSWEWGAFKSRWGWTAQRWALLGGNGEPRAMVQLLRRNAGRLPLCVLYAPKGPAVDGTVSYSEALEWLERQARVQRAVWMKVDGDLFPSPQPSPEGRGSRPSPQPSPEGRGSRPSPPPSPEGRGSRAIPAASDLNNEGLEAAQATLRARGWLYSPDQVQFRNTMHTDVRHTDEVLLAQMKQKWRYNIRLAEKRGVTVRVATPEDWPALYAMYAETGRRDGFIIRGQAYYEDAWRSMNATALVAEHPSVAQPMAGLVLFRFAESAWYFYGMSRSEGREHMPNYLLQWTALRWARDHGCATYDWWGAPEQLNEADDMWGVYRFKDGFGARFVEGLGAWDFAPSAPLYKLYTRWMPALWQLARSTRPRHHGPPAV